MKHIFTLFLFLLSLSAVAQREQAEALFGCFKSAAGFDYKYPREKVYMHFDNSSYLENDTIWYKAYVVRASSLHPTTLSRILYVELLNADGAVMEKQTLRLDSLGQAHGFIKLTLPVRSGYYEVRGYTREMVNWGTDACFSRVFPVFGNDNPQEKLSKTLDNDIVNLSLPQPEENKTVTLATPRPYTMKGKNTRLIDFYPEGGVRLKGVEQRIAFKITDGRGRSTEDTLRIYTSDGTLYTEAAPEYDGMGEFLLPADFGEGYVQVGDASANRKLRNAKFPLPNGEGEFGVSAYPEADGWVVRVLANDEAVQRNELLGLAVLNRERPCYFDTLTVNEAAIELFVPSKALRGGVNRVELFDTSGRSLATRLVWQPFGAKDQATRVNVQVQQNKAAYSQFEPAVLRMQLNDVSGKGVKMPLSVAVRDRDGNLTADGDGGMEAELLLASEVRGYIHRPDLYFAKNDAAHRRMLDLLLMVQGWTANTFDVMCGKDTFNLRQPIEDKLILRGTLYKDNNKFEPRPNFALHLMAYGADGNPITGDAVTDRNGGFAFESKIDFKGDYLAYFSIKNEDGKRRWSRLTLDRWFSPQPRAFNAACLELFQPNRVDDADTQTAAPETFEWKDTIPNYSRYMLHTAEVKAHRRYKGFTGNRYTYGGGEKNGMSKSAKYYNIQREAERLKDMGISPGNNVFELMALLNKGLRLDPNDYNLNSLTEIFSADYQTLGKDGFKEEQHLENGQPVSDTGSETSTTSSEMSMPEMENGIVEDERSNSEFKLYLNNIPLSQLSQNNPEAVSDALDWHRVKSVTLIDDNRQTNAVSGEQLRTSRARYSMYIYNLPNNEFFEEKRGREIRHLDGFSSTTQFYSPNYRQYDMPTDSDVRRTLYWNPDVQTDANGSATVIFYTNSREAQHLDISVRGITADGKVAEKN